jgi:hypothetical protein
MLALCIIPMLFLLLAVSVPLFLRPRRWYRVWRRPLWRRPRRRMIARRRLRRW